MVTVSIPVTGPDMNWIVGRLARELVERLPRYGFHARINQAFHGGADIEYHSNVYFAPSGRARKAVGLFAHDDGRPAKHAAQFDGHVVLNPDMRDLMLRLGAPNPRIIEQAVDGVFLPTHRPIFGVAGSVKPGNPRKGEALVTKMLESGYDVRAWGKGWPCPIVSDHYDDLPAFYKSIDYYVVTSSLEGGCTPIIECMALNKPVISPKIGFAICRPVLEYEKGSWESLRDVLFYLTNHRTYEDWAADHAFYFREILG